MKRKNANPYQYSLQHTQERAFERYAMNLTPDAYDELTAQVRSMGRNDAVNWEGKQGTFILSFRGRKVIAVFDVDRDLVTTLLPPEDFAHYLHY